MLRSSSVALLTGLILAAAACTNPASSQAPSPSTISPQAQSDAPSEAPSESAEGSASAAPSASASDGATSYKVGYISLGESIPFVNLVSDSINEEAERAGVEIAFCDSEIDAAKALACAQNLNVQDVQAVLNFQLFEDSSAEICQAYGNLPTIAIDIVQEPCQVAFMGADNERAGRLAGEALGEALQTQNGCEYEALVTLDTKGAGATTLARMNGMIAGFEEVCGPIDEAKFRSLDVGGTTDAAVTKFSDTLSAIRPGGVIPVLSLNDDMSLGALAAARTAGRQTELRIAGQGADPTSWKEIACNPQWIADTAYFPERYGSILIPAVVDLLEGREVPENLFVDHEVITSENVRTVYPETPAC